MNRNTFYRGRDVHGILLLDKPQGLSSNAVLQQVKHIYNANRAGHTGTLDPLATGILPICLGEATKFSQYLLNSDKRYHVIAKLGQRTNTSDSDSQVIEKRPISFNLEQLNTILESFHGNILQVPPMYSALKYQGKKLYEYARKGIKVPRSPRVITIYELLLIRYENTELELEIHCSKGTYIRTLIENLGESLDCGAHVTYLRRIAVSKYSVECMITLDKLHSLTWKAKKQGVNPFEFLDPLLIPIDSSIGNIPIIRLSSESSIRFKNGNSIFINCMIEKGLVRVIEDNNGKFIGIGEINDKGYVIPRRLIAKYFTKN